MIILCAINLVPPTSVLPEMSSADYTKPSYQQTAGAGSLKGENDIEISNEEI